MKNDKFDIQPTVDGLLEFKSGARVTFASAVGRGRTKKLEIDLHGNYIVSFNKQQIYFGTSAQSAIKEYNLLP